MTAKLYITDTADPNDEFDKLLKRVNDEAILGLWHFRIARGLSDMAIDDPAIAETASAFFFFTQKAHLQQALLHGVRLFDKSERTATIRSVLNHAENDDRFTRQPGVRTMLRSARDLLSGLDPVIRRVRVFRDKSFVHLDLDAVRDPQKFAEASSFTISDVENLLTTAEGVVCGIRRRYNGKISPLELFNVYDYQSVLRMISDSLCAKIKTLEAHGQQWTRKRPKGCAP
jgi:AbiU2